MVIWKYLLQASLVFVPGNDGEGVTRCLLVFVDNCV